MTDELDSREALSSKKFGDPPTPLKKPILGGKRPKWTVSLEGFVLQFWNFAWAPK